MTGRGLIVGAIVLSAIANAELARAQNPGRPVSLVDRLNSLRKGWGNRENEGTERQPQTAAPSSARSAASRYPRVDSRKLLPPDFSEMVHGTSAEPGAPSRDTPSSRIGARPRAGSNTAAPKQESILSPGRVPNASHSSRGLPRADEVLPKRVAAPILPNLPGNSTRRTYGEPASTGDDEESVASRPSPTIRHSPTTGSSYDFDLEELRRDLVDSTGQPVIDREANELESLLEDSESFKESESASEEYAEPGSPLPAPMVLGTPEAAPLQDRAPLETADSAVDVNTTPSTSDLHGSEEDEHPPVVDASDQRRVRLDGEKAFTHDVPDSPTDLPTNPFHAGTAIVEEPIPDTVHSIGSARGQESFLTDTPSALQGDNVLVSNRMPVISSQVSGPKEIMIGREATYKLRLVNEGNVAANEVVASVRVPAWADVLDTSATNGIIQRTQNPHEPNTFRWQVHTLPAQATEFLELKLIPRSSRPLELGLDWSYAPAGSRAVVEVQEPKLRMHVSGPDEVLHGKPQLYRLTLTNPGTGTAEEVRIDLLPPGGGDQSVSSHYVGELPPGTSRSVEVELTAREPGKLFVKASANAAGDVSADASKEIFCRKPELEVDWRGPEQKYSGTMATYYFRVRNPGTAAADDVEVAVQLPSGVEFLRASDGQVLDPSRGTVKWRIASLRPGDDYYMELKCLVNAAGVNTFDVSATTAAGDLTDHLAAETRVVALADLKLNVSDPKGPVPVGEEAIYEIRVYNRGSNTAEDVNIVALFSEGIDAESVEGAQSSIADGRVTFRTIEKLQAGREVVLRIRARANVAGTHVFRAEVLCRDLEIKLAAEETTRFFQDEVLSAPHGLLPNSASNGSVFDDATSGRY